MAIFEGEALSLARLDRNHGVREICRDRRAQSSCRRDGSDRKPYDVIVNEQSWSPKCTINEGPCAQSSLIFSIRDRKRNNDKISLILARPFKDTLSKSLLHSPAHGYANAER